MNDFKAPGRCLNSCLIGNEGILFHIPKIVPLLCQTCMAGGTMFGMRHKISLFPSIPQIDWVEGSFVLNIGIPPVLCSFWT